MRLTQAERLTLWNQYEILKRLDPEQADYYARNQEVIGDGYELYYSELNLSINSRPVDKTVCEEVQDILMMFRAIHFSLDKHEYTPASYAAYFEGFDANETTGHYSYARFVRRTLGN